jgi:hypothetical protein
MALRCTLTVFLCALCGWGLTLVAGMGEPPASLVASVEFEPVASAKTLLEAQREAIQRIDALLDPATPTRNADQISIQAELIAEYANLCTLHTGSGSFRRWSIRVRDTALDLSREARKHHAASPDRLIESIACLKAMQTSCADSFAG